jgi:hypothetical protein
LLEAQCKMPGRMRLVNEVRRGWALGTQVNVLAVEV